ncbi:MAG: ankyrin repeat domain-containing protein [Pseudomonadota bacterium]|nr:ankyrin repeat domain-containing protein [Pseudomonadota bacterium]
MLVSSENDSSDDNRQNRDGSREDLLKSNEHNDVDVARRRMSRLMGDIRSGLLSGVKRAWNRYSVVERTRLINQLDENGYNILHLAILEGREAIVKFLIANGADFKVKTSSGVTPLELAVCKENEQMVQCILNKYPKDSKELSGHLASAINQGKLTYANQLLDRDWSVESEISVVHTPVALGDGNSFNALDEAMRINNKELVIRLLGKGFFRKNIDKLDRDGRRPVHWAAFHGNLELYKYLCAYADTNFLSSDEKTVMHFAVLGGDKNLPMLKHLLKLFPTFINMLDDEGKSPLYYAAKQGSHALMRELIAMDKRPILALEGEDALTSPLHEACRRGDVVATRMLLEAYPEESQQILFHQKIDYKSPYEIAVIAEREIKSPIDIVATQEAIVLFMHQNQYGAAFEFNEAIFAKTLKAIDAIPGPRDEVPGSEMNQNLKDAAAYQYNQLHADYDIVFDMKDEKNTAKTITQNNKILCLALQLEHSASRFVRGDGTKQVIATEYETYSNKKLHNERMGNLVRQVAGAILCAVIFGLVGFAAGVVFSAGSASLMTGGIAAWKGAVMGYAAFGAAGAGAGLKVGGLLGLFFTRSRLKTLELHKTVSAFNKECKKQARLPQPNNLLEAQSKVYSSSSELSSRPETDEEVFKSTTSSGSSSPKQ